MSARKNRSNDRDKSAPFFRSERRLFEEGGKWYFFTREEGLKGPFANKFEASQHLDVYIKVITSEFVPRVELAIAPVE
jgi:hypothetical protein